MVSILETTTMHGWALSFNSFDEGTIADHECHWRCILSLVGLVEQLPGTRGGEEVPADWQVMNCEVGKLMSLLRMENIPISIANASITAPCVLREGLVSAYPWSRWTTVAGDVMALSLVAKTAMIIEALPAEAGEPHAFSRAVDCGDR